MYNTTRSYFTESGYHSDHMETPHSSLSESPMFEMEDRGREHSEEKPGPFSGGEFQHFAFNFNLYAIYSSNITTVN